MTHNTDWTPEQLAAQEAAWNVYVAARAAFEEARDRRNAAGARIIPFPRYPAANDTGTNGGRVA